MTLASEAGGSRPTIVNAVAKIEQARARAPYTSTQENAWLVMAARAMAKDSGGVSLDVAGDNVKGALYRSVKASELAQPLKVTNTGEAPLQAVVSVSGAPTAPEPAAEKGFKIERLYYTLDGEEADPTKAKQNQRFVVVLKITEPEAQFGRVLVADYLPAGFEIDNPRLVSSGETGTLSWIENAKEPAYSEFRDERFSAAFERQAEGPAGVRGGLCGARGVARPLRAAAGLRRGHVPAGSLRPHRYGHDRDRAEVSDADETASASSSQSVGAAVDRRGGRRRVVMCGRSARCRASPTSSSRRRCSTATAGCCAPMRRRTAAGGCRRRSTTSIRASSRCCKPTRTGASASTAASIRWR